MMEIKILGEPTGHRGALFQKKKGVCHSEHKIFQKDASLFFFFKKDR